MIIRNATTITALLLIGVAFAFSFAFAVVPAQAQTPTPLPQAPMSADKCGAELPALRTKAEACLKIAGRDPRKKCFAEIDSSLSKEFSDECKSLYQPFKTEMGIRERLKYPERASANKRS